MIFFMVFLIFYKITYVLNKNAGSAIFSSTQIHTSCWTSDDIAKLKARRSFEDIVPSPKHPEQVNSKYIKDSLKYYKNALVSVQKGVDQHTAEILKEALADTLGAHLKCEILPTIRFAYYAGYIPFRSARKLHDFYDQIKIMLNTQGVGWKQPQRIPEWSNLTVAKILIGSGKFLDPCACLIIKRDANNCIHLPPPRLDNKNEPSAIALPFKREGLASLKSPNAESILLKYYTTASRCLLHSSPANCRHADVVNFNNELWHWMKREVAPHLIDEKLYAAYGGILRIAAAVQNYGKSLSRRNLFEYQDASVTKWNPWKSLTESHICTDKDWTPALYVIAVILIAVGICLLQICYDYMFGQANTCRCKAKSRSSSCSKEYRRVDTSVPAFLPRQSTVIVNNQTRSKRTDRSNSSSIPSIKTQKVYDMNENTEKMMAVLLSDNEDSDGDSTTSRCETEEECDHRTNVNAAGNRSKSPPKLETSIAQLTIEKSRSPRCVKKVSTPMYSTSTLTHSNGTFREATQQSESGWSGSSTSTSGKSISTSSKSHSQRSRSSRDLMWARNVIARNSRRTMLSSSTEPDGKSFITPPSRR